MNNRYIFTFLFALLISVSSCDKDLVDRNINPVLPSSLDPTYQLVTAQLTGFDSWHYESEIVQQIQLLIGGQEAGGNYNTYSAVHCDKYYGYFYPKVKELVDAIFYLKDDPSKSNLYNMCRIMKAHWMQILTDYYGDVPYFEAGKAYLEGIYFPKYDNNELIYADLVKELEEAVDGLDATKDLVKSEAYYAGNIAKWKKLGNSLLLRVGMRYSKVDPTKAAAIVAKACDPARGGVITSNSDNAICKYNTTQTHPLTAFANSLTKHNWYIGKPFLDFLKDNNDPRLEHLAVLYSDPTSAGGGVANTNPADQIGCPFGYDENTIVNAPDYPGKIGATFKYSQISRQTANRINAWNQFVNAAQTNLLLAEARQRGWITVGQVKDYYEAGIRAHMSQDDIWSTVSGGASPITVAEQDAYLLGTEVAFDPARALEQINTQYWVACVMLFEEAWGNFRRSGYPALSPTAYPGEDPSVSVGSGGDGFIHRLRYPNSEWSVNKDNTQAATTRMGGDTFGVRLFWDKK